SATYAWNTGGVAAGAHTLNLGVTDGAGRTATASISVTVAPSPLTASTTSPPSGATVSGIVTVNMAAGNAQGSPTQFVLQLDNATTLSTQSVASGATATYAWDTSAVATGAHTLNLSVTDGAGRTASAAVSVTVAPPPALTASITSPASGATVTGTVTVSMAAGNAQGSPTQFVLQLDNATTLSTQSVSGSAATYAWDTSAVASGAHTLNLSVTDGAGRTATAAVSVTVAPPPALTASITSPTNGATV